ncbi:MAG: methyl-accepting chemotaxis protein [Pseudomonadota bacterium]
MERYGIGPRIYGGFAAVLGLLLVLAIASFSAAMYLGGIFTEYRAAARQTLTVSNLAEDLFEARVAAYKYRIDPSDAFAEEVQGNVDEITRDIDEAAALFDAGDPNFAIVEGVGESKNRFENAFLRMRELQLEREKLVARIGEIGPRARTQLSQIMETAYRDGDPAAAYYAGLAQQELMLGRFYTERYLLTNASEASERAEGHLQAVQAQLVELLRELQNAQRRNLATTTQQDAEAYLQTMTEVAEVIEARNAIQHRVLDALGPQMQTDVDRVFETVAERQDTLGPAGSAGVFWTMVVVVAVSLVALAAGVAMAVFIARSLTRGVEHTADNMDRLAGGDLGISITGDEHETELGRMAKSLRVFKDNAVKMRDMAAEKEAVDRRAEADRNAMTQALAEVVEAASAGDFARRMRTEFEDPGYREIAAGVNTMVESVDSGVSETARVVASLSKGDLTDRMHGNFKGAFAELQRDVGATMDELSRLMSEIIETSVALGNEAGSIADGSESLSERAAQQASSLEETSATMEEISATVKSSADNSAQAQELAGDASARAVSGSEVVDRTVAAMNQIKDGSAKISEIISVIDGLAFQTNLLALNAAVEAARAGDAGKGFAVVASEVRALAKQSSDAAKDIRDLIEESGTQVTAGVDLVGTTGKALESIVSGITEVEKSISAIAVAAKEQTAGIDEITSVVSHMDSITQQNAAMANESASNAKTLSSRADRLRELVAFFKIDAKERLSDPQARAA